MAPHQGPANVTKASRLTRVLFVCQLVVSAGIIAYLVASIDWNRVEQVLPQLKLEYLWQPPLLLFCGLFFSSVRWTVLLACFGVQLRLSEGCFLNYLGKFYSLLLPGVIGGDVIRIGLCAQRTRKPVVDIAVTTTLERVFGLLAVLAIGSVVAPTLSERSPALVTAVMPKLVLTTAVVLAVLVTVWQFASRVRPRETHYEQRWLTALVRVFQAFGQLKIGSLVLTLVLSGCSQACDILATYHLAKAIGIDLPAIVFFGIIPIVYLATAVPISLGGLGIREGALVLLLSQFGIATSDSVLLSFVIYLVRALVTFPAGAVQLLYPNARNTLRNSAKSNGGGV
jgi:uncharacterized protein (TIRG00374 family)